MMMEKKQDQMKRREWLFKAAEAAALALFGTMGLKEVAAAVSERVREKMAEKENYKPCGSRVNFSVTGA
jgi:hypothetical protein